MQIKLNYVEVNDIFLISSSFKIIDFEKAHRGGSVTFKCEVQFNDEPHQDGIQLTTKIIAEGKNDEESLFKLSSEYVAEYRVSDINNFHAFPESERVEYCLSLIFPIIREDSMNYLSRAGLGQIQLPYHFNSPQIIE